MRVILVGLGYWGSKLRNVLTSHSNYEVVALVDKNSNLINGFTSNNPSLPPQPQVYSSLEIALKEIEADAVFVCTPPDTHFEIAKLALDHHLHVWVEKPNCISSEQYRQLCFISESNCKLLFTDWTYLYNPYFRSIKQTLKPSNGKYRIKSHRINKMHIGSAASVITDLAVHDFSILYFLFADRCRNIFDSKICLLSGSTSMSHITIENDEFHAEILVDWMGDKKSRDFEIINGEDRITYCIDQGGQEHLWTTEEWKYSSNLITPDALTTAVDSFRLFATEDHYSSSQHFANTIREATIFSHYCLSFLDTRRSECAKN